MQEEDSTWPGIKKIIAQDGFTKRIITFDANKMKRETIAKVNKLLVQKANSFDNDTIKKASQAVAPLAQWVKANIRYFAVLEKVDPLKRQIDEYAKKIQKKAEDLYKLAVEKGTPVLEKTTRELKEATANALKKIVAKLEEE